MRLPPTDPDGAGFAVSGSAPLPRRPGPDGLPVTLDLSGAHCLVAGGGPVAARKAGALVAAGARVTVVATDPCAQLRSLADDPGGPGSLELEVRPVAPGDATGCLLVVCATGNREVDAAVADAAADAGALVNRADTGDRRAGSVDLAAVHRVGPVTVAVSTGGASPALAAWVRDRVAAALGPEVAELAALVDQARRRLAAAGRPTGSVAWADTIDEAARLLADGRRSEARRRLDELA
jgi:siroheme synthase-like protein